MTYLSTVFSIWCESTDMKNLCNLQRKSNPSLQQLYNLYDYTEKKAGLLTRLGIYFESLRYLICNISFIYHWFSEHVKQVFPSWFDQHASHLPLACTNPVIQYNIKNIRHIFVLLLYSFNGILFSQICSKPDPFIFQIRYEIEQNFKSSGLSQMCY